VLTPLDLQFWGCFWTRLDILRSPMWFLSRKLKYWRNYCRVERNGSRDTVRSIARRDHRKSKFGLRQGIKLYLYRIGNVPNLDPGRVNCRTRAAAPRRRDACMFFFFENLRNPARNRRVGLMCQFRSSQLNSIEGKVLFGSNKGHHRSSH
jgi:hypothetical protein